jgi:hypothetical protein
MSSEQTLPRREEIFVPRLLIETYGQKRRYSEDFSPRSRPMSTKPARSGYSVPNLVRTKRVECPDVLKANLASP